MFPPCIPTWNVGYISSVMHSQLLSLTHDSDEIDERCNPHSMWGYMVGTFMLGLKCDDWLLVRDKSQEHWEHSGHWGEIPPPENGRFIVQLGQVFQIFSKPGNSWNIKDNPPWVIAWIFLANPGNIPPHQPISCLRSSDYDLEYFT